MRTYFIYYLFDVEERLLYIGRSYRPKLRLCSFQRRTGIAVTMGICQRHKDFIKAQQAERAAIKRHHPPYNNRIASTAGTLGYVHTTESKKLMRQKRLTKQTKKKLSEIAKLRTPPSFLGGHHSKEARERISHFHTGRKRSSETILKMKAAWIRRKERNHAQTTR